MSFRNRIKTQRADNSNQDDYNVDLAPMLALMVALVPMILLAAAFIQVKVFNADLGISDKSLTSTTQGKVKEPPHLEVQINKSNFLAKIINNGKTISAKKFSFEAKENYQGFLVSMKERFPKAKRIIVKSNDNVNYENIIKVIDMSQVATVAKSDEKKNKVELFPLVSIGDLVE